MHMSNKAIYSLLGLCVLISTIMAGIPQLELHLVSYNEDETSYCKKYNYVRSNLTSSNWPQYLGSISILGAVILLVVLYVKIALLEGP